MEHDQTRGEVLERHVKGLSKHFDCLVIIGTWMNEHGQTCWMEHGHGNHYARVEIARKFARQEEQRELAGQIASVIDIVAEEIDEDDDDDDDPSFREA